MPSTKFAVSELSEEKDSANNLFRKRERRRHAWGFAFVAYQNQKTSHTLLVVGIGS